MHAQEYRADVIIAGGGIAGMVAAFELLNAGKKVLLLDRDQEANFGGLAKWAFGGMFFVDTPHQRRTGIRDSIDLAQKDWFAFAEFEPGEQWGKAWANKYIHLCTPHGYRWLREKGLGFFPVVHWVERGLFQPGNSVPRFHLLWGTGWELVRVFRALLNEHPHSDRLQLAFNHRVLGIEQAGGAISGVTGIIEGSGQAFEAMAPVVVIASGGINGSIEKVRKNWHPDLGEPPETILNGSHEFAIGDLHEATEMLSGHIVHLEKQWNYAAGIRHYQPRHKDHGLSLVPCKSALWLNFEGKRMGPVPLITGYDTRFLVERICQEPVKYSWQVLNRKIAWKEFAISGSEHNELVRDKKLFRFLYTLLVSGNRKLVSRIIDRCEDVVVARSIPELTDKMNELTGNNQVRQAYLEESIRTYDDQIRRGPRFHNDEQLRRIAHARQYRGDRSRTCRFQPILDQKAMPLIAIREFVLSRKSLGGIQTDLYARVLTRPLSDGTQQPIPGLYAIGESAGFGGGGIHGLRSLEGTFLGACVITARVAAAHISNKKLD